MSRPLHGVRLSKIHRALSLFQDGVARTLTQRVADQIRCMQKLKEICVYFCDASVFGFSVCYTSM